MKTGQVNTVNFGCYMQPIENGRGINKCFFYSLKNCFYAPAIYNGGGI